MSSTARRFRPFATKASTNRESPPQTSKSHVSGVNPAASIIWSDNSGKALKGSEVFNGVGRCQGRPSPFRPPQPALISQRVGGGGRGTILFITSAAV